MTSLVQTALQTLQRRLERGVPLVFVHAAISWSRRAVAQRAASPPALRQPAGGGLAAPHAVSPRRTQSHRHAESPSRLIGRLITSKSWPGQCTLERKRFELREISWNRRRPRARWGGGAVKVAKVVQGRWAPSFFALRSFASTVKIFRVDTSPFRFTPGTTVLHRRA